MSESDVERDVPEEADQLVAMFIEASSVDDRDPLITQASGEALVLRDLLDYSRDEAAEALGKSVWTVDKSLYRARDYIQEAAGLVEIALDYELLEPEDVGIRKGPQVSLEDLRRERGDTTGQESAQEPREESEGQDTPETADAVSADSGGSDETEDSDEWRAFENTVPPVRQDELREVIVERFQDTSWFTHPHLRTIAADLGIGYLLGERPTKEDLAGLLVDAGVYPVSKNKDDDVDDRVRLEADGVALRPSGVATLADVTTPTADLEEILAELGEDEIVEEDWNDE